MARVSAAEGISYGFGLFGYLFGVFIVGFLLTVGGAALTTQSPIGGLVVLLIGGVSLYAGIFGTGYKVIADAVDKGNRGQDSTAKAQKVAQKTSDESSSES